MKLNVVDVLIFIVGAILIYAAVKGLAPKDVVSGALGNKPAPKKTPPKKRQFSVVPPPDPIFGGSV